MGLIKIEKYSDAGTVGDIFAPVLSLKDLVGRASDATTSTSPESFAIETNVQIVRVYTDVVHRLSNTQEGLGNGEAYAETVPNTWIEVAVTPGQTLHYRQDV